MCTWCTWCPTKKGQSPSLPFVFHQFGVCNMSRSCCWSPCDSGLLDQNLAGSSQEWQLCTESEQEFKFYRCVVISCLFNSPEVWSYGNSVITNASSLRYFHANETQTIPITFVDFMLRLFYFVECLCLLLLTFFFFPLLRAMFQGIGGMDILKTD